MNLTEGLKYISEVQREMPLFCRRLHLKSYPEAASSFVKMY